jgi:hypothetical protein
MYIKRNESLFHLMTKIYLSNNTAAQCKNCNALPPDQKAQVLTIDAVAHKKQRKSLLPEQKGQVMTIDATVCKKTI